MELNGITFVVSLEIMFQSLCSYKWGRWLNVSYLVPATSRIWRSGPYTFHALAVLDHFQILLQIKGYIDAELPFQPLSFRKWQFRPNIQKSYYIEGRWTVLDSLTHTFFREQKNKDSIKSWRFGKSFFVITSNFHDFFGFYTSLCITFCRGGA